MSVYLTTLVATSALVGICSFLSFSEGEDKGLRVASSVILVYALSLPLVTLFKEEINFEALGGDYPDISFLDTEFSKSAEQSFADGVEAMLTEKFSLSPDNVEIVLFGFDTKSMRAEKIKVILTGSSVFADARGIEAAVSCAGLGECEVEIGARG